MNTQMDFIADVEVSVDGTWHKRGYSSQWSGYCNCLENVLLLKL